MAFRRASMVPECSVRYKTEINREIKHFLARVSVTKHVSLYIAYIVQYQRKSRLLHSRQLEWCCETPTADHYGSLARLFCKSPQQQVIFVFSFTLCVLLFFCVCVKIENKIKSILKEEKHRIQNTFKPTYKPYTLQNILGMSFSTHLAGNVLCKSFFWCLCSVVYTFVMFCILSADNDVWLVIWYWLWF